MRQYNSDDGGGSGSDSGFDEGRDQYDDIGDGRDFYDEIGDDFINSQIELLFGAGDMEHTFSSLLDSVDADQINNMFEDDLRHAEIQAAKRKAEAEQNAVKTETETEEASPESELKHDCMWNGICCGSTSSFGSMGELGLLEGGSGSPIFKLFEDFMRTESEIKVESNDFEEEEEVVIKEEPEVHLQNDLGDEDAMCWSNETEQMWTEDTPPPSQPSTPFREVIEDPESDSPCRGGVTSESYSFRDLDWRDAIDDSKEMEDLELRRNAALNDHSYANPIHIEKPSFISHPHTQRKIQGIVLKEENGDDYSGGPRKTKILVPLKDLMESLNNKTFVVAPLGPGKKIIRLTGKETVKGMLGVHHAAFNSSSLKSVSSYCVPQTSLFNRSANHSSFRNSSNIRISSSTSSTSTPSSSPSHSPRHKKPKTNRSIMREGGTITFPNQIPSPSPPDSPLSLSGSSSPTRSPGLTASGRPRKTKTHNNMERMRRIDLRNSFDSLKKLVPPLAKSSKCSKVEILRRAEEYIRALKSLEKRLQKEEATVRSRNEQLKLKLIHSQQQ